MHVGLGRGLQEAELIIAEENADVPIDCTPPCHKELPEKNFQKLFFSLIWVQENTIDVRGKIEKKKKCPPPKTFNILYAGAVNNRRTKKQWIASFLWKNLLPLH